MNERRNGWHLNRSVPIALGVALIAYVLGAVWWTASLSASVKQNRQIIESRASHSLRIGVLEERWRYITAALDEIKRDLKALRDKP